jgi:pyrroloquinoline quinone biosynthesis protein B
VAAGGGLPQWNCACAQCEAARTPDSAVKPSLQCSLAFSADGDDWYLVGATPDIHQQISAATALRPRGGVRQTPIQGVLLPSAELDQVLGLLMLREGTSLDVYATAAVEAALCETFPIRKVAGAYATQNWVRLRPDAPVLLESGRLSVTPVPLGRRPPRYIGEPSDGDWVVGYSITDCRTGGTVLYAPSIDAWGRELEQHLARACCAFVDGTFWSPDEMVRTGAGNRTAAQMGHLPIGGEEGSALKLAAAMSGRKVYVHINNTNPILDPHSSERAQLATLGLEVGLDGMEFEA